MKKLISNILSLCLLTFTYSLHAGLYKGLDEEGNVVYSDEPFTDSEEFTPPAITVVKPTEIPIKEKPVAEEETSETIYTNLSITSPTNDQTIWNEPQLTVSLQTEPVLNTNEGHSIWLLMDGAPLVKNSTNLSLQLGRAERGSHSLQAQIRNQEGKILKSSQAITIHIKHAVIKKQPR